MSISDWMVLGAAGSGVIGTVIIFAKSYALPSSGLRAPCPARPTKRRADGPQEGRALAGEQGPLGW